MGQRRGSSEPWRRPVEDVAPEKHPGSVVFGDGIPHTEIGLRSCTASPAAAATPAPTARLIPGTPSRRLSGIEPIPLAQLGRPRIDVTIRIRDFFRDACPHVVTMLDDASLSSLPGLLVLRVVSSFTSVVGGARMRHGVVYCASGSR